MNNLLIDLIHNYISAVDKVMLAFFSKYKRKDLLAAYRGDKIIPKVGHLKKYGIKQYVFHGIGLRATLTDNTTVEFDFAFIPEQRHDGFDLYRLAKFVSEHKDKYYMFVDNEYLKLEFFKLIRDGIILRPNAPEETTLYFLKDSLLRESNGT